MEECGILWNILEMCGTLLKSMKEYEREWKSVELLRFKMEDNVAHDGDMFKLTANNYSYWKPMMKDYLYCKDLHKPIIYKDKLESMIQKKTPRNKANLVRRLVKLEYKDGQKSWDTLVVTLSNSAPEGKLTMDTVSDSLLGEEARSMKRGESIHPEANIIENKGRNETRGCRKSQDQHQSRGRSKSRSKITCYYYGRMSHKKIECQSFKRDQKADNVKPDQISPTKKQEENSTTAVVSKEYLIYLVDEGNILNIAYDDSSWIVDSGASFHVTPHGSFFSSYRSGDFDVKHVPTMRLNLIFAGKLDDVGLINYFGEGKYKLTKGSLIMARGKKEGSLYVMQAKLCKGEVNITTEDVEIWHKRLGHISEKGLHMLARKQLLPDVKGKPLDPCAHCLARKQHKVAFQRSSPPIRRKNILDLIHTDVNLLKSKDQVLDAFKEFHVLVERETGQKIKCVRSANGEAIMVMVKIVNLTPSVPLNGGIPEEVWMGKRAIISSSNPCYKARLVVKGFRQEKVVQDLEIEQLDVKTAFLHSNLEEEIYIEQPEGFKVLGKENLVCRLTKSLYWLKQEPRQWYKKFDSFMAEHDFKKMETDHCVFMKRHLCFGKGKPMLEVYTDAYLAVDIDSRKLTLGYLTTFAERVVSWKSKLQKCVALSTTKEEYIATTESCKEMLWMKNLLLELGIDQEKYILKCGNQSAVYLAKKSIFHSRTKHIDNRYHWIREVLEEKKIYLDKIHTDENWSDMMTNVIPTKKFEDCCQGVVCFDGPKPGCNNNTCSLLPSNRFNHAATIGEIALDVLAVHSTDGKSSGKVVWTSKFLFTCGTPFLLEGLASGVQGVVGLGAPKGAIFFGDGPCTFMGRNIDISKSLMYTPLILNRVSTASASFQGDPSADYFIGHCCSLHRIAHINLQSSGWSFYQANSWYSKAVAPFSACFNSKSIGVSCVGPGVQIIDLNLPNEVVWRIFGFNSMVKVKEDVLCLAFVNHCLRNEFAPMCVIAAVGGPSPEVNTVAPNSVHPKPEWTTGGIVFLIGNHSERTHRENFRKHFLKRLDEPDS
ncbi:hypothetical protein F3Y22_tig00113124pilonHSYRG00513 [Hibiscus syriacus]|uniref:Retrovirus-related Pol polyprotein from transposon TNT 1-94 n=1 Tax=Hibiscus syriacus TaxID=106335 RepID=A0A6A2WQS0_HIBSY|nr:hypothetical protein F3Y22_tig00113124pilonHSYRG00513 [Hibiscus syriacus]